MMKNYQLVILAALMPLLASCGTKQNAPSVIKNDIAGDSGVYEKTEENNQTEDEVIEQEQYVVWQEPDYPVDDLSSTIKDTSIDIGDITCIKDENLEIHLGDKYDDFSIDEEEIEDNASENNFVGDQTINGNYYKWFYHKFSDILIESAGYGVANNDFDTYSPTYYLSYIELWSSKYTTDKGISIGSTLEEVKEAYGEANLEYIQETNTYQLRDDEIQISFEITEGKVSGVLIYYYRYYPFR